jgi:hypothetical protein
VIEVAKTVNTVVERFEPLKNPDNSVQFKTYLSENPAMGRVVEEVGTALKSTNFSIIDFI